MRYALALVPTMMLLLALASWPYGYYTMLRLVVTACAVSLVVMDHQQGASRTHWTILLVGVALLFNPLIPVYLNREIWSVLDVLSSLIFGAYALELYRKNRSS